MSLDGRIAALLRREFATIRSVRDRVHLNDLAQIQAEMSASGMGHGTPLVHGVDERSAVEYRERQAEYLRLVIERLAELRVPWTEGVRGDVHGILTQELRSDWEWVVRNRDAKLGERLKNHATGLLTEAQQTAQRRFEEELDFRVLREERHRLPLADLLSAPRYQAVLRHWQEANQNAIKAVPDSEAATRAAISSVEALARLVVNNDSATLGDALKQLQRASDSAARLLWQGLEKVWAFTNQAPNTRHGGGTGDPISPPEARFVIETAGAALRLLLTYDLGHGIQKGQKEDPPG